MTDCVFENNTSGTAGGAIRLARATATLTNCTFTGNTAGSFGDDICISGSQMALTLAGENTIADLEIYDEEASTIKIAEGASGAIDVSFTTAAMHAKHYADADPVMPLFTGDGFAAAYTAGVLTLENEDYRLLSNGHLEFKGAAKIGDTYYADYAAANAAAKSGDTIVLTADATVAALTIKAGVTLDLNGKTVTAPMAAAFAGAGIVDSSAKDSGKLVCPKDKLAVMGELPALPLWVDEGEGAGYYFFATPEYKVETYEADGTFTYLFLPRLGAKAEELLGTNGAEAIGAKFMIRLANDTGVTVDSWENLRFSEEDIMTVYGEQKAFFVKLTGYESFANLTIQVLFKNADGFTTNGWRAVSAPTDVQ